MRERQAKISRPAKKIQSIAGSLKKSFQQIPAATKKVLNQNVKQKPARKG